MKRLPKSHQGRCVVLDIHGKRCNKKVTHRTSYHGDGELYSSFEDQPQWVIIDVCALHAAKLER